MGQPDRHRADQLRRAADLALACMLIAFTLPLMVIVALAIKLESPGRAFSTHDRLGPGGRRVAVLSFRTTIDKPSRGEVLWWPQITATRVGRFLRYTRIDELPQLVNVLRGDMTLLGTGRQPLAFLGWR